MTSVLEKNPKSQDDLFQAWLEQIILFPTIEKIMDNFWIQLPPEIPLKSFQVSRRVNDEVHNLQQSSTKSGVNSDQCNTGIQLVINVAKAAQPSADLHGDVSVLAAAVTCGRKFATKLLNSIKASDENKLFESNLWCDSLLAADWLQKLEQFIFQPENSYSVPGNDAISVRYGLHHPKYLLLHLKLNIATKCN